MTKKTKEFELESAEFYGSFSSEERREKITQLYCNIRNKKKWEKLQEDSEYDQTKGNKY